MALKVQIFIVSYNVNIIKLKLGYTPFTELLNKFDKISTKIPVTGFSDRRVAAKRCFLTNLMKLLRKIT